MNSATPRPAAFLLLLALFFAGCCFPPAALAEVTRLEISERRPYADGRAFPSIGAYEFLRGVVHFAVDPKAQANRQVVDLEHAARNGAGRVEFSADFEMLAPVDRSKANGTLLYDVNNRGRTSAGTVFNSGADHFLMRKGYVVVSSGWIGELLPGGGRLRLQAPLATDEGQPIRGMVRTEMVSDVPAERLNIAHWAGHGSYRPTERGLREATLTWRQREKDHRVAIPREQFRLEIQPLEPGSRPEEMPQIDLVLSGGFRPGYIYELIYEAQGPLVQGLGLVGIRDLVSFLKRGTSEQNPLRALDGRRSVVDKAIGFGVSQSGRALRMLVYEGFNADEQGRIVFDGLMPHVAGAGLGFFNHRFALPTRTNGQHEGHLYPVDMFPFTYGEETDPFTGRTDGILRQARAAGVVPKVMHTDTSAEYWHRSASLVHTDPLGKRDAVIPPQVRIYAIGGAQHAPGNGIPGEQRSGNGWLPANPTDYRPLLRALLTAMNAWIRGGTEPPASRYPRISEGTLTGWQEKQSGWRALPGVRYPEVIQQPELLDHGPEFLTRQRRLSQVPPLPKGHYVVRVPAYGPDNNERGMLLLPTVAVPVGTFTGWNVRHPQVGADGELLSLTGGYVPLARTDGQREATGDPRPSLEGQYPSFDDYLARFTRTAQELVRQRYVLEEDVPRLLELAERQRQQWQSR